MGVGITVLGLGMAALPWAGTGQRAAGRRDEDPSAAS